MVSYPRQVCAIPQTCLGLRGHFNHYNLPQAIILLIIIADDDCAKNKRPCKDNSVCVRKGDGKSECECIKGYDYNWRTKFCEGMTFFRN